MQEFSSRVADFNNKVARNREILAKKHRTLLIHRVVRFSRQPIQMAIANWKKIPPIVSMKTSRKLGPREGTNL